MVIFNLILSFNLVVIDSIDLGNYVNGISFGNGIVWADENGNDYIYKINPNNLQIIGSIYYAGGLDGLAFDGNYLWIGYYPNQIHKIDTFGNLIGSWPSPGGTYSYGMAYDGNYLWHTDKNLKKIYKLDPSNPTNVIGVWDLYFNPRDLEIYENRFFITSETPSQRIYVLDEFMNVIDSANTGWRIVAGIGIGGGYLWVGTTALQGWLYKCDLSAFTQENSNNISKDEIKIYPNLFSNSFNLKLNLKEVQKIKIEILDLSGKIIDRIYDGYTSYINLKWDTNKNNSGIYILRIRTPYKKINEKIILIK